MYKLFIDRPIVSMVIAIIMVIVGAVAVLGLPTSQFPNIADPQIQVLATYVGADALTVEQSVATPIEQQMSGVDNMEYMYSLNANNGTMNLTIDFNVKTDASTDQILAQMRQNQAAGEPKVLFWPSGMSRGKRISGAAFAGSTNPPVRNTYLRKRFAGA